MELLHFIFSSPWIYFGTVVLIAVVGHSVAVIAMAARGI